MKTYSTKSADLVPQWHVFDASGKTLGRLASEIAILLLGKHKPIYTYHLNTGDYVIVVNAAKVTVTGKKAQQKMYYRHSNYPGGLKSTTFARMMETYPTRVIESAVKGMLPHNRQGRAMMKRLKIYKGDMHPHQAQVKKADGVDSQSAGSTEKGA